MMLREERKSSRFAGELLEVLTGRLSEDAL